MSNPITVELPADLPTDWQQYQVVSPNGTEAGLDEQHGYNYLMEQVNNAQTAAKECGEALGATVPASREINGHPLTDDVTLDAADVGASPAPNLLVNGNFAYNPKGLMTYTDRAESVKGWSIEANGAEVTVDGVIGISIEIVSGHSDGAFLEVQELNKTTTASFIGKQITLSALIDRVDAGNSDLTAFFGSRSTLAMRANTNGITAPGLYTATMEVTREIVDKDDFCVCFRAGGTTALDFHVAAVKLEIGTRQTLAKQDEDGNWVLIPQMEFDTTINAIRSNCYDDDGNFLDLPRGLGAADRNFTQSVVVGIGSTGSTDWLEVGRVNINTTYKSLRVLFSVCGVNGRGSGILSFSLRVDGTANVIGGSSRLYWLTLDDASLENAFAIEQDGDYAVLYQKFNGTYQMFHIGILDYGLGDRWTDPTSQNLFKLANNYNLEGNHKSSINAVLTSSTIFTPEIFGAAASRWGNGRLLVGGFPVESLSWDFPAPQDRYCAAEPAEDRIGPA